MIIGNWKMNGLLEDSQKLIEDIKSQLGNISPNNIAICPPFTLISKAYDWLGDSGIAVGSQDCHTENSGAYTGNISAGMLADLGCKYAIVGHSERRTYEQEADELVNKKAKAAVNNGVVAVICIGETLEERESGKTLAVIEKQLLGSIPAGATAQNIILAYEPVWAIGTGKTPTLEEISEVHEFIRKIAVEKLAIEIDVKILYGGSVKPTNANEILAIKDVDGALVGGASLKAADFIAIANSLN